MTPQQSKYIDKQVAIVSLIAAIIGGIFSFLPTFIILSCAVDQLSSILKFWMIPFVFILLINNFYVCISLVVILAKATVKYLKKIFEGGKDHDR